MKTVKTEYTILVPHQRLDSIEANAMKEQFMSLLGKKSNLWIVDMTNVEFIDSSGLSVLTTGLKTAREIKDLQLSLSGERFHSLDQLKQIKRVDWDSVFAADLVRV